MNSQASLPSPPPRLLLGAALLFWGGMIGHPVVGLLCAFLVEGRAWFNVRWDFSERAFTRAWTISLTFLTLAFVWRWMEGLGVLSLFRLLSGWPLFFLPLILVQNYGTKPFMLLNTFSVFARRKMQQDRKEGRRIDPIKIHFGYIYLAIVLMSSALGQGGREVFFTGLCVFVALAFFFSGKNGRQRPVAWVLSMTLAGVFGLVGAIMLDLAYRYIESGRFLSEGSHTFPEESMTAIGRIGERKLSHKIFWRVQVTGEEAPSLYREAVFNKYGQGLWRHEPIGGITPKEDFEDMPTRGDQGDEDFRFVFDRRDLDIDQSGARKLVFTGALDIPGPTPIPLPSGVGLLRGLQADGIDYNSLGTVVVANPDHAITRFEGYLQKEESLNEKAPMGARDFEIPEDEEEVIRETVDALGLRGLPEREILARVKHYFASEFHYTLYHRSLRHIGPSARGSMATFLRETKRGHCEYFATAAVLLLREAGVPARYAVGFAAKEKGRAGEWLLRGQHGHAWCRVYLGGQPADSSESGEESAWIGGRWIDFDPTPGTWLATEGSGVPWGQTIVDWWQLIRQEILLWRNLAENRARVTWAMGVMGAILLLYILVRLWTSRLRRVRKKRMLGGGRGVEAPPSPLATLTKSAEALLGPRPLGRPLTEWILEAATLKPALAQSLERAVHLHWRTRFDPLGLEEEERKEFQQLCRLLKQGLRG